MSIDRPDIPATSEQPSSSPAAVGEGALPVGVVAFYRDSAFMKMIVKDARDQLGDFPSIVVPEGTGVPPAYKDPGAVAPEVEALRASDAVVVVCDGTMEAWAAKAGGARTRIAVYDLLREISRAGTDSLRGMTERWTPVIDAIRAAGRTPVALQHALGDHWEAQALPADEQAALEEQADAAGIVLSEPGEIVRGEYRKNALRGHRLHAALLMRAFPGVRLAPRSVFANLEVPLVEDGVVIPGETDVRHTAAVVEWLRGQGIDPAAAVLLMDHHAKFDLINALKELPAEQRPSVALACPCCIADPGARERTAESGLAMFPVPDDAVASAVAERVVHAVRAVPPVGR